MAKKEEKGKRLSILRPDTTIIEVARDMVVWLIETCSRTHPYISVVSKQQLWHGGSFKFPRAPTYIQSGLLGNCGIRQPSSAEIKSAQAKYGYNALVQPWSELNRITNLAIRKMEKLTLPGEELDDIRITKGWGYVTNQGKIDYTRTAGIAVYMIFSADSRKRRIQNQWIKNQQDWVGYQVLRVQMDHPKILAEKKRSATDLVNTNRKLLRYEEYLELEPGVDRQHTPWEDEDE